MAILEAPALTSRATVARDSSVDLARAACLTVVVGLHAMMAGVTIGPHGPAIVNALEGHPMFAAATWLVQIMPLFFVLGGFSSLTQWRRWEGTVGDYIRSRVLRLAQPAALLVAAIGGTLAVLWVVGVDPRMLQEVSFRVGQPLWFLGVYLGCSALVPLMARLHSAAPRGTLAGLALGAGVVDLAAASVPALGYLNFVFVWLFVQQLGFWLADGRLVALSRRRLLGLAGLAFAAMGALVAFGYSPDMFINLNPPTLCLLLLGVAQLCLLALAQPWLRVQATRPLVARASAAMNRHSMSVYLWHLPAIVLVAVLLIVTGSPLPGPLSLDWWATRPLWLTIVALTVVPLAIGVARAERLWPRVISAASAATVPAATVPATKVAATTVSTARASVATVLAICGVVVLLVFGFTPVWTAALALTLLLASIRMLSRHPAGQFA